MTSMKTVAVLQDPKMTEEVRQYLVQWDGIQPRMIRTHEGTLVQVPDCDLCRARASLRLASIPTL